MTTTAVERRTPGGSIVAWRWLTGGLAVAFGVATLVEGGHVLFGSAASQAEAGNVVPFILLFNFGAAFAYVLCGMATVAGRPWAVWVARALAVTTLVMFAAFGVHVLQGSAYEIRTVAAMSVRSAFWVAQGLILPALLRGGRTP